MRKFKVIGMLAVILTISFVMTACNGCNPTGKDPVLTGISVTTQPFKTTYLVGEKFDKSGMVVTATYKDESTQNVTTYDYSPKTDLALTDTTIIITYEGKQTELTIKVREVVSIRVKKAPDKTRYIDGETFDKTGMVLEATYSDGTTGDITKDFTVAPEAMTEGTTSVTVTYAGKTTTQDVKVVTVKNIVVKTAPNQKYIAGDAFDKTGMVLTVTYSDDIAADISTIADMSITPATLAADTTSVTITYKAKTTTLAVYMLSGIRITKAPDKVNYIDGDTFDKTGMIVVATYTGLTEEDEITNYTVDTTTAFTGTEESVKVSYGGFDATQAVSVKTLLSITVSGSFTLDYITGETFDPTGVVITANFDKGPSVTLLETEYSYNVKGRTLKKQDANDGVVFTYRNKTSDKIDITVFVPVTGVTLDRSRLLLGIGIDGGATLTHALISLEAGVAPDVTGVVWASEDETVATVDSQGVITMLTEGTTKITVTADDDSYNGVHFAECVVEIVHPIGVSSRSDFEQIFDNRTGYFYLTDNIDFGTTVDEVTTPGKLNIPWFPNIEWAEDAALMDPVGTHEAFFSGVFDGRGYTISNLEMVHPTYPDHENQTFGNSIFGVIGNGGVVRNLGVSGFTATGSGQVSVIAAQNFGIIENCYFEDIHLTCTGPHYDNQCAGAVIASMNYNLIRDCVIASAFSTETGGGARIISFVVRNRASGAVINCFSVADGLAFKEMTNFPGGSFAGSVVFALADIAGVDFSKLGAAYWNIETADKIPVLKELSTPTPVDLTGISLNETALTMEMREQFKLIATLAPTEATYRGVEWSSSDPEVAKVDKYGLITALTEGTTTITAQSRNYALINTACEVTVAGIVEVDEVILSETGPRTLIINRLGEKESFTLSATYGPQFSVAVITYASSDPAIATVDANGKVTAVADGDCVITVTATDTEAKDVNEEFVFVAETFDITVETSNAKIPLYSSSVPNDNYLCNITAAANPSLEFVRGPFNPDGSRAASYGDKYLGTNFCVGLQVAVCDAADDSVVGYFWVVGATTNAYIVASSAPTDANALPVAGTEGGIVLSNIATTVYGNLYLTNANTNAGLAGLIKAMDDTLTGANSFKLKARYVAVAGNADYETGAWGALTTRTFTITF